MTDQTRTGCGCSSACDCGPDCTCAQGCDCASCTCCKPDGTATQSTLLTDPATMDTTRVADGQ